jgi:hypothetical protein
VVVFSFSTASHPKRPGFSVVRSEQGEIFYATIGSKGELVATNLQVGKDNPVAHGLSQGLVPPAAVNKDCDTQLCKEEEEDEVLASALQQHQQRSINNANPKSKKTNHKKAGQARYTSTAPPETTTTTKTTKKKSQKRHLRSLSTFTTTTATTSQPSLEPTKEPTEEGIDKDEMHAFGYDDDLVESEESQLLPLSSSSSNGNNNYNTNHTQSWRSLQTAPAPRTMGTIRNLVVPIRFSNHVGRTLPTRGRLLKLFNHDTAASGNPSPICPTGSIRDVFLQNSYGKLNLVSTVLNWVDVPFTEQQIAAGTSGYVVAWLRGCVLSLAFVSFGLVSLCWCVL